MSRLSELIAELCPDGVEYKTLGEVAEIRSGWGFPNKYQGNTEGEYPFYKVKDMNSPGNERYMRQADNYISTETALALKCKPAPSGSIVFPKIGAAIATEKRRVLTRDSCYDNNVMALIPNSDLAEGYLQFVFSGISLSTFVTGEGAVPSIRKGSVEGYSVPVPPIEVQREIVRILDSFQELDDALSAEIAAREKQLATLCDRFVCNEAFEQKTLGEVCQLRKGRGLQKKDFSESGVGCIHYGQIYTHFGLDTKETLTYVSEDKANGFTWVEPNDIVVAITSENVEDVCKSVVWTGKEEIVTGAHAAVLHPKINPLYLAYCLRSHDFERQKIMIVDGVKVIEMKIERLSLVKLRVPSRLIQDEIVDKLESVRGLINEMKIEREARRKQFAYYRDKLLDLPEKVTT